jgi:hypothetical protein
MRPRRKYHYKTLPSSVYTYCGINTLTDPNTLIAHPRKRGGSDLCQVCLKVRRNHGPRDESAAGVEDTVRELRRSKPMKCRALIDLAYPTRRGIREMGKTWNEYVCEKGHRHLILADYWRVTPEVECNAPAGAKGTEPAIAVVEQDERRPR